MIVRDTYNYNNILPKISPSILHSSSTHSHYHNNHNKPKVRQEYQRPSVG